MMNEPLTIKLKTLTPLWTGGVDGNSDRLHATSIIGSLRWWYEALVRGLGGYVSDPTSEKAAERSEFDTKAYEQAKRNGLSQAEAIQAGIKTLCPVAYLFGATGWARLFQLQVLNAPTTPLHFRSNVDANRKWLADIFGGEAQNLDNLTVPYGELHLRLVTRGYDAAFAIEQTRLAFQLATDYGGLGARLQHGFGQITVDRPIDLRNGLTQLTKHLKTGHLRTDGPYNDKPFDLRNLVTLTYDIPSTVLSPFSGPKAHCGSTLKRNEQTYLPCVFDLRYKGTGRWGMRRWLKEQKGWKESNAPDRLAELDMLLGPRSQWGRKGNTKPIRDELRTASRLFFSMPYQLNKNAYRLRIFGFAPPSLLTVEELSRLIQEYMIYATNLNPTQVTLGKELIVRTTEGAAA